MFKQAKCRAVFMLALLVMISGLAIMPAAGAETGGTRTVSTVMGDVQVPENPRRIISSYIDGDILALGGTLIAADEPMEGCAYYDQVANLPRIDKWEPEEIMALDPDLIFVIMEDDYHKLKDIAPTILIPFGQMSTLERVAYIAQVLGVPEKGEQLIQDFHEKTRVSKEKLEASGMNVYDKTFTILEMWEPGSIMIMGDRWGRGGDFIYNSLAIPAPEKVRKEIMEADDVDYLLVSQEVLPSYCGDILLVTTSEDGQTGFEGSAIWESLPAVKSGYVIAVTWNMFYFDDILSLSAQMDRVVDTILSWPQS